MRKWAVIYSSVTGNTKAVAAAMAEQAGAELFRVQDAPADLSAYEAVALGYWLRRGGPDDLMKAYLPRRKCVRRPLSDARRGCRLRARRHLLCARGLSPRRGL